MAVTASFASCRGAGAGEQAVNNKAVVISAIDRCRMDIEFLLWFDREEI